MKPNQMFAEIMIHSCYVQ